MFFHALWGILFTAYAMVEGCVKNREESMLDQKNLTQALSHVLWIGGSPCAGKSTIGHTIARTHVFLGYHLDPMARNHLARRLAAGDEALEAFLKMSMDQRWLERSVEALVQEVLESWTRECQLAVEDLLAMPNEWFIIAEGNFFPECVAPYISSLHQAIWLVPTGTFCGQIRQMRDAEQARRRERHRVADESSDPGRRLRNLIGRDCQLARYVKQQAEKLHLPVYEVDGGLSLDEVTALVEKHFEPYLIERLSQMNRL
jgi:adenylate kinase family enzyme